MNGKTKSPYEYHCDERVSPSNNTPGLLGWIRKYHGTDPVGVLAARIRDYGCDLPDEASAVDLDIFMRRACEYPHDILIDVKTASAAYAHVLAGSFPNIQVLHKWIQANEDDWEEWIQTKYQP